MELHYLLPLVQPLGTSQHHSPGLTLALAKLQSSLPSLIVTTQTLKVSIYKPGLFDAVISFPSWKFMPPKWAVFSFLPVASFYHTLSKTINTVVMEEFLKQNCPIIARNTSYLFLFKEACQASWESSLRQMQTSF